MLVGILADTHIPYRISALPQVVLDALKDVDIILHAGDVDEPWALHPLKEIAPVYAVKGNYHILDKSAGGKDLPFSQKLTLCGHNIVVTHGHWIGWSTLLWRISSIIFTALGFVDVLERREKFTSKYLMRQYPDSDIYIYGHTHHYFTKVIENKLIINPGAACATSYFNALSETSVVLLTLEFGKEPIISKVCLSL